jgi:hypothetical protein
MFQNAYALFFLSALIGSAAALNALVRAHAAEVIAVLRGKIQHHHEPAIRPRYARIRSGRRPALPQVQLRISRL